MATPTAKYEIDDIVYLTSSANIGFLEAYRIDAKKFVSSANTWAYKITILKHPPVQFTVQAANDLRKSPYDVWYTENEFVTICNAIDLAITRINQILSNLNFAKTEKCGSADDEEERDPSLPKFDIGDEVYIRQSATIGFLLKFEIDSISKSFKDQRFVFRLAPNTSIPSTPFQISNPPNLSAAPFNIDFTAFELIPLCEALDLAIAHNERELQKLVSKRDKLCIEVSSDGSGTGS